MHFFKHLWIFDWYLLINGFERNAGIIRLELINFPFCIINYRKGLLDFEIKPKVITALKDFKSWSSFDDSFGKLVNVAYMEIEKEEF